MEKEKNVFCARRIFTAITTTVSEFGDIAPRSIYLDNGNFIHYSKTNKYVLGTVSDKDTPRSYLKQIDKLFNKNFGMFCNHTQEKELLVEDDEDCIKKEKKAIKSFFRSLNLIVGKKNVLSREDHHKEIECDFEPLMISDVDLLISSINGQPNISYALS